jgi:hypothetical protein
MLLIGLYNTLVNISYFIKVALKVGNVRLINLTYYYIATKSIPGLSGL